MEDDTAAEDRAVGGVKDEQPVGDTVARSAVNVAATARRADLFDMAGCERINKNERRFQLSVLPTYVGTYVEE